LPEHAPDTTKTEQSTGSTVKTTTTKETIKKLDGTFKNSKKNWPINFII